MSPGASALEPGAHDSEGGRRGDRKGSGAPGQGPGVHRKLVHTSARSGKQTPSPPTTPDQGRGVSTLLFPGPTQTKARFWGGAFSQGGETPLPLSPSSASSRVWHPKGFLFREKVKVQIPNFRRAGTPVLAPPSPPRPATARLWLTPGPCLPEVPEPHPLLSSAPPPIPDNLLPAQLPASLQPLRG